MEDPGSHRHDLEDPGSHRHDGGKEDLEDKFSFFSITGFDLESLLFKGWSLPILVIHSIFLAVLFMCTHRCHIGSSFFLHFSCSCGGV